MKKISYLLITSIIVSMLALSCEEVSSDDDDNNNDTSNNNTSISGKWEGNWYFDFDGIVRGDCYDILKSSVDNKIYICGAFLEVSGNYDMKNLVRWNPSTNTWEQVAGIDYYHTNFIRCMVEDNEGNLYFGGDFSEIGGITAGKVAKFDVSNGTWSNLRDTQNTDQYGPVSGGVYDIEYMDGYVYIGGHTFNSDSAKLRYIRRYNVSTSTWEAVGQGTDAKVTALCTDGSGNLYAGGSFENAGGINVNYIAKWDGSTWSALDGGTDNYVLALHCNNGNLYAGGSFTKAGGTTSWGIAKWTGSAWETMNNGIDVNGGAETVQTICSDSDNKIYIGGDFEKDYDGNALNHVAVYDGGTWNQLGAGLGTTTTQIVMGSYADGKNIYFAGYFSKGDGNPNVKYNTAIWNETRKK